LIIIPQRVVHQTLVGKDRSPLPSSYSPECVEGEFSEVPRTKAYGILKKLWHPQESLASMESQASSLESR
jgi:hypothetical protein